MEPERAFADTNLFLRFLTNDVPPQADAVERLFRVAAAGDVVLLVTGLTIAEIVWTLESYYGLAKAEIQGKVLAILNTPGVEVSEADVLLQAVDWYVQKNVDFIDAYHAAWLMANEVRVAFTFDQRHFARFEHLQVKVPGMP